MSSKYKKVGFEFDDSKVRKLIILVRDCKMIWDLKDDDYKQSYQKAKKWLAIGEELKEPHELCKRTWTELSNRMLKEMKASRMGNIPSKWKYFQDLTFLYSRTESRPSSGNLTIPLRNLENREKVAVNKKSNALVIARSSNSKSNSSFSQTKEEIQKKTITPSIVQNYSENKLFLNSLSVYIKEIDLDYKLQFYKEMTKLIKYYYDKTISDSGVEKKFDIKKRKNDVLEKPIVENVKIRRGLKSKREKEYERKKSHVQNANVRL